MSITIFLEKVMQSALTSEHPSNNDRFADNAVEEGKRQKKLTPPCCQCTSEDDRFANCSLLTTSICWKEVKNSNKSLKDWTKNSCWIWHGNKFNLFLAVFQQLPKVRGQTVIFHPRHKMQKSTYIR